MAAQTPTSCRCGCPHAALIPIYWNLARPVRLPLPIIHGVNASDHRFGGFGLTLACPSVNRHQKVANDAAEWLPDLNECWYVARTIQVRQEYGLTIDQAEADAIDRVLAGCDSTEMIVLAPGRRIEQPAPTIPAPDAGALALYDNNGNGRITCAEARAHGIAPVSRDHAAYQYMRDADGDGPVCE